MHGSVALLYSPLTESPEFLGLLSILECMRTGFQILSYKLK